MHPTYLSNAYLVGDEPDGTAVIIDTGAAIEPLLDAAEEHNLTVAYIFNTHEHHDHTIHNIDLQERFGAPLILADDLTDGQEFSAGNLTIAALATPGHTDPHFSYVINGEICMTGDVLFAGSVGGTLGCGAAGFDMLRSSIMDTLMTLPPATVLYPGHNTTTTVSEELESNPFVRLWRGVDQPGDEHVVVMDHEATLRLWAGDYDGGNKAWVEYPDGRQAIVGGSSVERKTLA